MAILGALFLLAGLVLAGLGLFGPSAAAGSTMVNWGLLADRIVYAAAGAGFIAGGCALGVGDAIKASAKKRADEIADLKNSMSSLARALDTTTSAQSVPVYKETQPMDQPRPGKEDWPKPDWLKADRRT